MLGNDVARAAERGLHIGHFVIEKLPRRALRIIVRTFQKAIRQRLQTLLSGRLCASLALRFVGQIEVFELICVPAAGNALAQFGREFALLFNRVEDIFPAVHQFFEFLATVIDLCYLHLVQSARRLFAVAADKGNGGTAFEQVHRPCHLPLAQTQLFGNKTDNHLVGCGGGEIFIRVFHGKYGSRLKSAAQKQFPARQIFVIIPIKAKEAAVI